MSPTEQEDLRAMLSRSLRYRCWRMITTGWCLGGGASGNALCARVKNGKGCGVSK